MALTQREAFARLVEHMVKHDGNDGHGYSQRAREGSGVLEVVDLGGGCRVSIMGGDRDCSSAVITALKAVGVDTHGATYTGNMRSQLLKTGLFRWERMGVAYAKRGDIYLNERNHTAVCIDDSPDLLAQFSIAENGTVHGRVGDQSGRESNIRAYYSYPWDGKLVWASDGASIGDMAGGARPPAERPPQGGADLGEDLSVWGPKFSRELQRQRGTTADGIISGQFTGNRGYFWCHENTVRYGKGGSPAIKSLQGLVGASPDGHYGPDSIRAHQRWLNSKVGAGLEVDGYHGKATNRAMARALQARLYEK